jgi:hypothetical protein
VRCEHWKTGVYFLTGHGEFDPESSGEESYSQVKTSLENKNYTVGKLDLLSTNSIPQDANVIVIAGPLKPITDQEITLIKSYVDGGGSLIALEEPLPLTQYGAQPDPLADYLSEAWGLVGQRQSWTSTNQPYVAVGSEYGSSLSRKNARDVYGLSNDTERHPK